MNRFITLSQSLNSHYFKKNLAIIILVLLKTTFSLSQTTTSWTGASNSNWSITGNWTNGTPTATVDAIIGDASFTTNNQPTLNSSSTCKSLTIGAGTKTSTLTINSNSLTVSGSVIIGANGTIIHSGSGTFSLTGDWNKTGGYNATSTNATVNFNGSTLQYLNGATTFQKFQVAGGASLLLNANIDIARSVTISGTLDPNEPTYTVNNTSSSSFTVNSGSILYVKAATFNGNYSGFSSTTINQGSTVNYAASTQDQTVSSSFTYSTLIISGSGIKSLSGNLPDLNSNSAAIGNVTVKSGCTLDLSSFGADRGNGITGGTFTLENAATLKIGGTNSFPAQFATVSLGSLSTVEYYGSDQTITALNYGNLTSSLSGTASLEDNTTANGNLVVSAGSFTTAGFTLTVKGNATTNINLSGNGKIYLANGSAVHHLAGSGSFNNLELDDSQGATLNNSITVNGNLSLTTGKISTSSNTLTISSTGSSTHTNGYVFGNLRRAINSGNPSFTFEIGDASNYTPIDIAFTGVTSTGTLTANTTGSDHSEIATAGINANKSVNRYWTLSNSGSVFTSYNANFHFTTGDIDIGANTDSFVVKKYSGSWAYLTIGTKTSTTTQILNATSFGDFQIGISSDNPLPTTTHMSSTGANVGDGAFTITVNGTNFISSSTIRYSPSWNVGSIDAPDTTNGCATKSRTGSTMSMAIAENVSASFRKSLRN